MNEYRAQLTWRLSKSRFGTEPRLEFSPDLARLLKMERTDEPCEAVLGVCKDLRCPCGMISAIIPGHESRSAFFIDMLDGSVVNGSAHDSPEFQQLKQSIETGLSETDYERLNDWYLTERSEMLETVPITEVSFDDLPDIAAGEVINFEYVFPRTMPMKFSVDGTEWATVEMHSVGREGKWDEVLLVFHRTELVGTYADVDLDSIPRVHYNYVSGDVRAATDGKGCPPLEKMVQALKQAHPETDARLALHNSMLRILYTSRRKAELITMIQSQPKIGRNDRCPCGSGKKYKHCCINKQPGGEG